MLVRTALRKWTQDIFRVECSHLLEEGCLEIIYLIKSMKKVAGTLKIDQAQYRELEAFSKFSSDMDPITAMALDKGRKNNRLLIQPQYSPMPVGEQVAILYCGTKGLLRDITLDQVDDFQTTFFQKMRAFHQTDVLEPLSKGKTDPEIFTIIEKEAASIVNGLR